VARRLDRVAAERPLTQAKVSTVDRSEAGPVGSPPRHYPVRMDLEFTGEIWFWRGPSPWHFVTVPEAASRDLETTAGPLSYGWGMIPVTARINETRWRTSLYPKDGRYIVPVKARVRTAEGLDIGDVVTISLTVEV